MQDYEILSKLGSGSFGVVHKARDKKTNSIVVIKIVDISNMNAKLRKSAMDEGKILKQMNSPFIVKHYTTFINKSTLNIVMQYCPKGDLTAYMKAQMGKPFKEETIWKLSIQMMVGLRDLHAKKILHRDIKTLNVFLDDNYNVRIGDLGVAKSMTADFAHTIVGTPYYLSPEMCQEKPYNQKTDIWAMGCIIYELCAGKRPFEANNQAALALKIVMGKFQNIPSHYSSDLSWIVKSCLSVDYKRRPTAAYLLQMPKTKQWANKLNIPTQPNANREIKKQIKEELSVKKETHTLNTPSKSKQPLKASKSKSKDKPVQKIKLTKQGQRNVKQILINKVPQDNKPKKYSGAKRLEMKQKGKQQRPIPTPALLKIDKNQMKLPPKQKSDKQSKNVDEKAYKSQMPKSKQQNKQKPVITVNKFLPEDVQKLKQIDLQDEMNAEKVSIPDNDIQSSKKQPQSKQNSKSKGNTKLQLIQTAQKQLTDDQLLQQFGFGQPKIEQKPAKIQQISHFHLDKKPISINWNEIDDSAVRKNKSVKIQEIPTIKVSPKAQMDELKQMNITQQQTQDNIDEEINENRPYISDEQQQSDEDNSKQQLLIEDFDQKQQDLNQKLSQNQKRKQQLEKIKKHLQPQLLKLMAKSQYQKLKLKLIECKQNEVDEFIASWKNNISSMNLFYRIIHFDMQIKRCESNLKEIRNKLQNMKKQKE